MTENVGVEPALVRSKLPRWFEANRVQNSGGTVESLQDNLVHGNATHVTGTLTLIAKT